MTYRLTLFATSDLRMFGEAWTALSNTRSPYEVRAWLGAMRRNLAEMLAADESGFLLAVHDDEGCPLGVLGVPRDGAEKVTGSLRRPKSTATTTRTKEKTR